jgi:hypothetical protein
VTLESSFPWLSLIAAIGAGASPVDRAGKALRTTALAALALFAYFRSIAPAEAPAALMLGAWAEAFAQPGADRWRGSSPVLGAIRWLVFGYLFLRVGEGRSAFLTDAVKAALLVALLVGAGFGLARLLPAAGKARSAIAIEGVCLTLMAGAALTLYWSFWPAMIGAAGALGSEAILAAALLSGAADSAGLRRIAWALNYLGQAAMAYAFLR